MFVTRISKVIFTMLMVAGLMVAGLCSSAYANMLVSDLTVLKVSKFADIDWKLRHQDKDNFRIDCLSCEENIIINIQLNKRYTFGDLGLEAAQNAKKDCSPSRDNPLQCDTIVGTEQGNIMGIQATLKILDNFFVASYILGDEKTLVKIRTKASTKETAGKINQQVFEAMKTELILK